MKIIDLVCPNCNGAIHLDEDKEFGFCMHCGHRIVLAGGDIGNNRFAQIKRLKTTLEVKAQGHNQDDIIELCDRIIELDPNDSDAWYYKGLYALLDGIASEGLPYWAKSIEGMTRDEARDLHDYMVEIVANALFSDVESNIPLGNLHTLSFDIDEKTDYSVDDESSDFLLELIDKMTEMTLEQEELDSSDVLLRVSTITIILLSTVSMYSSIVLNREIFSAAVEELVKIRDRMSRISFSEPGLLSHDRDEVSRNISFISRVISEIDHATEHHTDEELERLCDYWSKHDLSDFMDYLLEARVADLNLANAGLLSISKYKNERSSKIQAFLDTYFEPLIKNNC